MSKYLSREFMIGTALIVVATVLAFSGKATFIEWASACGGFCAIFSTSKTIQKIKLNGKK